MSEVSETFDSINREKLFQYLSTILHPDDPQTLTIRTGAPHIYVKFNNILGKIFVILLGTVQGVCLSAIVFRLAQIVKNEVTKRSCDQLKIC